MAEEVLDNRLPESLDPNELESIRATLIQAYNAAFEVKLIFFFKIQSNTFQPVVCKLGIST